MEAGHLGDPWGPVELALQGCEAKALAQSQQHCLAERKRRERINGHLAALRELLPGTAQSDKASLLGTAVETLRELEGEAARLAQQGVLMPSDVDELEVTEVPAHTAREDPSAAGEAEEGGEPLGALKRESTSSRGAAEKDAAGGAFIEDTLRGGTEGTGAAGGALAGAGAGAGADGGKRGCESSEEQRKRRRLGEAAEGVPEGQVHEHAGPGTSSRGKGERDDGGHAGEGTRAGGGHLGRVSPGTPLQRSVDDQDGVTLQAKSEPWSSLPAGASSRFQETEGWSQGAGVGGPESDPRPLVQIRVSVEGKYDVLAQFKKTIQLLKLELVQLRTASCLDRVTHEMLLARADPKAAAPSAGHGQGQEAVQGGGGGPPRAGGATGAEVKGELGGGKRGKVSEEGRKPVPEQSPSIDVIRAAFKAAIERVKSKAAGAPA